MRFKVGKTNEEMLDTMESSIIAIISEWQGKWIFAYPRTKFTLNYNNNNNSDNLYCARNAP